MLALLGRLLLALVGYSAGAVTARRHNRPDVVDLVAAAGLLTTVVLAGPVFGRWASIGAAFAAGLLLGALVAAVKPATGRLRSFQPEHQNDEAGAASREDGSVRTRLLELAHALGDFQGRLLLALFFLTFGAPFALLLRIAGGRARVSAPGAEGFWQAREEREPTLAEARRQF